MLLFSITGLLIWWQGRREAVRIADNSPPAQADVLVFVASEGAQHLGFAQTLHDALVRCGHRVHTSGLEHCQTAATTRQLLGAAATHGEAQAHARRQALERIARERTRCRGGAGLRRPAVPRVLGFARAVEQALRDEDWPVLLPA